MKYKVPFNKPYYTGKETEYIRDAVERGHISGDGYYTRKCHAFFEEKYGFKKCLLTTSCTDALEMAALLLDIREGDEVIMPSFTFVSTANAFALRGAKIVFVDSREDHPGMDEEKIEELITEKTRVIVPVHYAGVACDMDKIMELSEKYNLFVVEDAAHAIDSYFLSKNGERKVLGSIGHLGAFSFHETKNISAGEGGMLTVNDERFVKRAEIIREKGTNRSAFFRGEVDKYEWKDLGSSFLPSDLIAAFLYAQIENIGKIQERRLAVWEQYLEIFSKNETEAFYLPTIPEHGMNNAYMFYLTFDSQELRDAFISNSRTQGVLSVFHYQSLHKSEYFRDKHDGRVLPNADRYTNCLVRLPFFVGVFDKDDEFKNLCKALLLDKELN